MLFFTISLTVLAITHAEYEGDEVSSRVWYGKRANIRDYPFYARVNYTNRHFCGAAILSHRWLVTAGHCYYSSYQELDARVWVGAEYENSASQYEVDLEILHPDYSFKPVQGKQLLLNDIALLRVKKPLIFSDKVKPIQLPQQDYEVNVLHSFAGLGKDETGKNPEYLMELTTRTHDINEYLKVFNETQEFQQLKPLISSVMICTKRDGDMPSICYGDSGSGLVRNGTVVGLASCSSLSGDCGVPQCIMFTNVYPFVDWIKSVTGLP